MVPSVRPQTFRGRRADATTAVAGAIRATLDLRDITAASLRANPSVLPVLRMCCCPPIARERLAGLSAVPLPLVTGLEGGRLPRRLPQADLVHRLTQLAETIRALLDVDLFPWLAATTPPPDIDRDRAASVVADRVCGAQADPIIRNAQEQRQLDTLTSYLLAKGYVRQQPPSKAALTDFPPGAFAVRLNVTVGQGQVLKSPVDLVVQPRSLRSSRLPLLFELKSAGDFTNVNKRVREAVPRMRELKAQLGPAVEYFLFLCGCFAEKDLRYFQAAGIDWVWEHRPSDLDALGL